MPRSPHENDSEGATESATGVLVIARVWTGLVARKDRDAYVAYVEATGVDAYRRTPGCTLATVLTRDVDQARTEIVAFSLWMSTASIQAFAGDDISTMVLYPQDETYLLEQPELRHYQVASPPEGNRSA
jgi:hypothetical protein